jgi:hypothetical protein
MFSSIEHSSRTEKQGEYKTLVDVHLSLFWTPRRKWKHAIKIDFWGRDSEERRSIKQALSGPVGRI